MIIRSNDSSRFNIDHLQNMKSTKYLYVHDVSAIRSEGHLGNLHVCIT